MKLGMLNLLSLSPTPSTHAFSPNIKNGTSAPRPRPRVINSFFDRFKTGDIPNHVLETLPQNIKQSLLRGERDIPLDPERLSIFYYKKDDWRQWANPMIYAILDDIVMLEKMRLADMSALDGAISNIRLWTLGSLDHKVLPNKAAINKLRDILASNVGGGTMELVWGPELSFQESNSEVYKFLGSEKYTSVLNSIYAGLGVPPTLTGMANNGGGFTNNFISLKTLVERLQYGRDQLITFWEKELEIVRQAMGFRYKAHIHFDQMTLADEAAEKNLLIQLADRDIISHETLLERFKEIPQIENIRIKRELSKRETVGPDKAGPFHPPAPPGDTPTSSSPRVVDGRQYGSSRRARAISCSLACAGGGAPRVTLHVRTPMGVAGLRLRRDVPTTTTSRS